MAPKFQILASYRHVQDYKIFINYLYYNIIILYVEFIIPNLDYYENL